MNSGTWLALALAALLGAAGVATWLRAEGVDPLLETPDSALVGARGAAISIAVADEGSGLRALRVELVDGDSVSPLLEEEYPGNLLSGGVRTAHQVELALDPARLRGIGEQARLRIAVRDWSWRGGFGGNESVRELPLRVDLVAPAIRISTGLAYAQRGGSGAVSYQLSEPVVRDGVQVGEHFFRGFPRPGGGRGERVAIFAIPTDVPRDARAELVAEDGAGNESRARWPLVIKPRELPDGNVTLSRSFLEDMVPRFAGAGVAAGGDLAAAFDQINTRIRAENEARIRELLADSSSELSLDGRFEQLANSKVTSRFGENRTYFFEGREISSATHFGYDLASFAAAPITAAAGGRVVFSGELGIYGNCVLIDHGLGLATLYGHLSRLDVAAGDRVERGQRLGLSGSTGLAGGDHLHFAVLVGGTYVDPMEWWDARWVRSHIRTELAASAP